MSLTLIRTIYDYNWWTHRRVWDLIDAIDEASFERDLEYSVGSIGDQIRHVVAVEFWWLYFLRTGELEFPTNGHLVDRPAIRATWDDVERDARAWLAGLGESDLARTVKPPFWDDDERPVTVAEALFQVANHGTDHRAQILAGLHRLGTETIGQDVLEFLHA